MTDGIISLQNSLVTWQKNPKKHKHKILTNMILHVLATMATIMIFVIFLQEQNTTITKIIVYLHKKNILPSSSSLIAS